MIMSIKQQEQLNFLMSLKAGLPDYTKQLKNIKDSAKKRFDAEMLANVQYTWKRLHTQSDKIIGYFAQNKARGLEYTYKNVFIAKLLTSVYSKVADEFEVSDNLHASLALKLCMNESQYFLYLNKIIDFWGNILIGAEVSYFEHKNDREMNFLPVDINYVVNRSFKKIKVYNIAEIDFTNRFKKLDSNYQEMILADLDTTGKLIGRPLNADV